MIGMTMDELCDFISHNHEAEFTYNGISYVIQPEETQGAAYLTIWRCDNEEGVCICRHLIPVKEVGIPSDVIDKVLNEKCFEGKSFRDIAIDITVETVF